jgi:DsbC/DsbD-like thiol-disulfide interchange protein
MMIRPLLAAFLAFCTAIALAQDNTPPTIKVVLPKDGKAGTKVKAMVEITFADGLHGYQNPASGEYQIPVVLSLDTKGIKLSPVKYPKGKMMSIGGDPTPAAVYEGMIKIPVEVTLPSKPGSTELKFTFSYQQCNDSSCFPPAKVSVSGKILVKK